MRKRIAALLCIALLMGLCACSQPAGQAGSNNDDTPNSPQAFGMLTLNMNAIVNVSYDEEGFVFSVSSGNEMGNEITESLTATSGLSCTKLVCDLIHAIADTPYATEQNTILLKQEMGSQIPSDNFLENIRLEAEKIAGDRSVILVTADQLTEDGYLSLDSAKELLMKQLKVDADAISGASIMQDGLYSLSVTRSDTTTHYTLEAGSGVIEEQTDEPDMDSLPEDSAMDAVENETEYSDPIGDIEPEVPDGEEAAGDETPEGVEIPDAI